MFTIYKVKEADLKLFDYLIEADITLDNSTDNEYLADLKAKFEKTGDENLKYAIQFLTVIRESADKSPIFGELYQVLKRMLARNKVKFIIKNDTLKDTDKPVLGYFDSSQNLIFVMLYKDYFAKKWILFTDYDTIDLDYVLKASITILHELMHYIAYNQSISYLNIWNSTHIKLLRLVIGKLLLLYRNDFSDTELFKVFPYKDIKSVYADAKFAKAFDIYYSLIRRTDILTVKSFVSVYDNVVTQLYQSCQWEIARFFDLILSAVINFERNGVVDKRIKDIYTCIHNAYIETFPSIENSTNFKSLFYQEIFFPSEISCICAQCSFDNNELQQLVTKTLKLV